MGVHHSRVITVQTGPHTVLLRASPDQQRYTPPDDVPLLLHDVFRVRLDNVRARKFLCFHRQRSSSHAWTVAVRDLQPILDRSADVLEMPFSFDSTHRIRFVRDATGRWMFSCLFTTHQQPAQLHN